MKQSKMFREAALSDELVEFFKTLELRDQRNMDGCFPAKVALEWFYGGRVREFEVDPEASEYFETERVPEPGTTVNMEENVVIS